MRFRLGLLQDAAAYRKQTVREVSDARARERKEKYEEKKKRTEDLSSTMKPEGQSKADEVATARPKETKEKAESKIEKVEKEKPKIKPLIEDKAIDLGANFVSETFLLLVGVALILGESYRQSRKETSRREDVADRIAELEEYERFARRGMVDLEKEILRLRAKNGINPVRQEHILPKEVYDELEAHGESSDVKEETVWLDWIRSFVRGDRPAAMSETKLSATVPKQDSEPKPSTSILNRGWPSSQPVETQSSAPKLGSRLDPATGTSSRNATLDTKATKGLPGPVSLDDHASKSNAEQPINNRSSEISNAISMRDNSERD